MNSDASDAVVPNPKLELETTCLCCAGAGGREDHCHGWVNCPDCGGAGYLPTPEGEMVLALIRHNLKLMLGRTSAE